ncbi:carboxypeptidase regulatory-like domain-containing protein [Leucobacter insecticola]|uniref:Carboxypeptidase regulatory-like domain-containing protein n=1 Tax=Leucobacter insecticola TaxID=2714934 RepID=A0A6G8FLH4_9MICO|nr:carboxypeptidase-like regulatory domain-containing protein [Leucobacter insecticola]QIM17133.1 carboxypeptidase regulatory-like domain-containing protein [Leucobacter insecticola]
MELTSVPDAGYPNGLLPYGSSSVSNIDIGAADANGVDLRVREVLPVSVSGTVATSSGLPVAGATVTLTGPGGPFTVTTASNGSYTLDGTIGGSVSDSSGAAIPGVDINITGPQIAPTPRAAPSSPTLMASISSAICHRESMWSALPPRVAWRLKYPNGTLLSRQTANTSRAKILF